MDYVYEGFKEVSKYLSIKYSENSEEIFEILKGILKRSGRGEVFNQLCEQKGFDENIEKLVQCYRNCNPNLKLYEDSIELLKTLKNFNIKTGIITDGDRFVQRKKIDSLKIDTLVDKIIVTDEFGREFWKPNKRSFEEIINYFRVNADEIIYVGDNPEKDFIGCKKLNINTVRIIREKGDHINKRLSSDFEADYEIKNLNEILGIIRMEK